MQAINLTDEQREFRAVVRRFAEDKIAPHAAATTDEKAEYDWDAFKALGRCDLTSLQYPEEYGGQGAPLVDAGDRGRGVGPGMCLDQPDVPHLQAGMLPVINFGRRSEGEVLPQICRRQPARPATASARPTPAATWPR